MIRGLIGTLAVITTTFALLVIPIATTQSFQKPSIKGYALNHT